MSSIRVSTENMFGALEEIIKEHIEYNENAIQENLEAAGEHAQKELKQTSKKRTGKYARGWVSDTVALPGVGVNVTVHNITKPSLTHLLEEGHEQWFMGVDLGYRTPGDHVIDTAYRNAVPIALAGGVK